MGLLPRETDCLEKIICPVALALHIKAGVVGAAVFYLTGIFHWSVTVFQKDERAAVAAC